MKDSQWRVLLPLGAAMLLCLSGDLTLYAALPARAAVLGLSLAEVGLILSANRFVRLASNPAVGLLLDLQGRRPVFLGGLALGALSTLGYLAPQHFWLFLGARLLWGISWSLIYVSGYSMIVDITGSADRGRGSAALQVFYFAGLLLHPLLGGVLADWLGLVPALIVSVCLGVLGFLLALAFLPETRCPSRPLPDQASPCSSNALRWPEGFNLAGALGWLLRQPQYAAACYLYMLATFAGEGILMSTATLYLAQRYGEAIPLGGHWWPVATMGGVLLALRPFLQIAAAPVAGHLSDRGGDRWPAIIWGVTGISIGLGLLALAPSLPLVLVAVGLTALGGGIICTLIPALVGDLSTGARSGLAMGGLMTVGDIGSAVAPLAAYALLTVLRLEGVYLLATLIVATGLALPWLARRGADVHAHLGHRQS